MCRDKLYDLLRTHQLLPKRRKKGPSTTQSRHIYYKHPNLAKDLEVLRPNLVWVSDITGRRARIYAVTVTVSAISA